MPTVKKYTKVYIDECRSKVTQQVTAYQNFVNFSLGAPNKVALNAALDIFATHFFNNMVLALDLYFVHRARNQELYDGNPLNEVRMLSTSIMTNDNKLVVDKKIDWNPANSVLRYGKGAQIYLQRADFLRLANAFFDDIERKYL